MSVQNIRAGISQAEQNASALNFIMIEVCVIAIGAGIYFQSWIVGAGSFAGLLVMFSSQSSWKIFTVVMALVWGFLAFKVFGFLASDTAGMVCGLIAAFLGFAAHSQASDGMHDLQFNQPKSSYCDGQREIQSAVSGGHQKADLVTAQNNSGSYNRKLVTARMGGISWRC